MDLDKKFIVKMGTRVKTVNSLALNRLVNRWHIARPLMLSEDDGHHFISIMSHRALANKAFTSNKNKSAFVCVYAFSFSVLFFIAFFMYQHDKLFNIALATLFITIFLIFEHLQINRKKNTVTQRARIFCDLSESKTGLLQVLASVLLLAGSFQFIVFNYLIETPSIENLIVKYGATFDLILNGEAWRILTGPYFHSGFIHWVTNFVMCLMVVQMFDIHYLSFKRSEEQGGRCKHVAYAICIFVLGNIVSLSSLVALHHAQILELNAYLGVSGGVFALLGFSFSAIVFDKSLRETKLHLSIMNFLMLSTVLSLILYPKISNSAHLAGFVFGSLVFLLSVQLAKLLKV